MITELPEGWTSSPLAALLRGGVFSDGDWIESKDQDPNGDVRLVQLADIGDGEFRDRSARFLTSAKARELDCTFLERGDVLVARMPEPLGRACLFPGTSKASVTAVDVCIVRPEKDGPVLPRYLMFLINSPKTRSQISEYERGTTRKRISRANLGSIEVPVCPLAEQRRIVRAVEELLGQVRRAEARLERVPIILKRLRHSVLAAAFSGDLTSDWRARNDAAEWTPTPLGQLLAAGPQNGLYKPQSAYGSGIPIVRIDDFHDGHLLRRWHDLRRLSVSAHERSTYSLHNGDMLINRVNSPKFVGKTMLVEDLEGHALFESNMMRITLDHERIVPQFALLALMSPQGRAQLGRNAKHAVNQSSINQTDVRQVELPVPDKREQMEVVSRVRALFSLAEAIDRRVLVATTRTALISQAILSQAFSGELVPTEAELAREGQQTFETAEALLARVARRGTENRGTAARGMPSRPQRRRPATAA